MKIDNFIDLVYQNKNPELIQKLVSYLPDKTIMHIAQVLIIQTNKHNYIVKMRTYVPIDKYLNIDIQKTHEDIKSRDFIFLSHEDCREEWNHSNNISSFEDRKNHMLRTLRYIYPTGNVIFKINSNL